MAPKTDVIEQLRARIAELEAEAADIDQVYFAMFSAAPQPEPVVIGSPLTERKAQSVIDRGYKITGYTLTNEQGQKCIVDMSAVRWFDDGDKFFRMMHPQPEPVHVEPFKYYWSAFGSGNGLVNHPDQALQYSPETIIPLYTSIPPNASARIAELEKQVAHWENNHETEVRRARILKERTDMPIERVQAYEKWGEDLKRIAERDAEIQELKEEIRQHQAGGFEMNNWLRPSMQIPRYISLMVKAMFKPTMDTQEAIKTYWDTWNTVYKPTNEK